MSEIQIIFNTYIIAGFCLGLRVLLSEGQILHFIRAPFDNKKEAGKYDFLLKPVILCVICFSSVWGGAVFLSLHGFHPIELIICCVSAAFIIKVINDKVDW